MKTLYLLNKLPYIFNFPETVTNENAEKFYKIGTKIIRTLNVTIVWVFVYITYSMIQTAFGNQNGLGTLFLPIFTLLLFLPNGYYLYKLKK